MFDLTNASHQEAIEAFEEQQKSLRTSLIIQSFISKSLKVFLIYKHKKLILVFRYLLLLILIIVLVKSNYIKIFCLY